MKSVNKNNYKKRIDNESAALEIIRALKNAGYEAYFVGGCVRDKLLGKEKIAEHDIATNAMPDEIIKLFPKTRKVGVKFGVVLVGLYRHWIEVATFRTDESYTDGRHPDKIKSSTIEEDAKRRDFTINGMYYDPIDEKLIDFVGGQKDIEQRIIRAIGQPEQRFKEDHLRMLRAVRFEAQLIDWNFRIEQTTARAVAGNAEHIKSISSERIFEEIKKILQSKGRAQGIILLAELGLLKHIIPELDRLRITKPEIWQQTLRVLENLPRRVSFEIAMTGLLANIGLIISDEIRCINPVREKPLTRTLNTSAKLAEKILKRLKSSNRIKNTIVWLTEFLPYFAYSDRITLADIKRIIIYNRHKQLLILMRAYYKANLISYDVVRKLESMINRIDEQRLKSAPRLLTGDDLTEKLNLKPGPIYQLILEAIYDAQLNEEITTKQQALSLARKIISEANHH